MTPSTRDKIAGARIERPSLRKVTINKRGFDSFPWEPDLAGNLRADMRAYEEGESQRDIARRSGCSRNTVQAVVHTFGLGRQRGGVQGRRRSLKTNQSWTGSNHELSRNSRHSPDAGTS